MKRPDLRILPRKLRIPAIPERVGRGREARDVGRSHVVRRTPVVGDDFGVSVLKRQVGMLVGLLACRYVVPIVARVIPVQETVLECNPYERSI